jgi:Zn-dependent M28 family amino/carboxypeptidase
MTVFTRSRRIARGAILVLLLNITLGFAGNLPPIPSEAVSSITPTTLRKHLSILASDEVGGRYTFSPGLKVAARYLASHLESFGYRGAANGSFYQKIQFEVTSLNTEKSLAALSSGGQTERLRLGEDFLSFGGTETAFGGDLVFVGYGISSPKNNHDDYASVDARGKVVVIVGNLEGGFRGRGERVLPAALQGKELSAEERGLRAAKAHGAVGAIYLPSAETMTGWDRFKRFAGRQQVRLAKEAAQTASDMPSIIAGPKMAEKLLAGTGKTLAELSEVAHKGEPLNLTLGSMSVNVTIGLNRSEETAPNVVGILDGTDPKLKDEYVVLSAHFDHVATSADGQIYNGADDDGSGTVSILEIARALSLERPKRSIVVAFHTGEELGLLGSRYFTDFEPLVPLQQIVANLNIDMIGRSRRESDTTPANQNLADANTVYVIGSDKHSSELKTISEQTNADLLKLKLDYKYDLDDRENFWRRSDHYNYAKHGIPIIFYFTGTHEDYHRPTDDLEKIDFDKMARIARTVYATAWRLANLDHRPVIDKKVDTR